MKRFVLACGVLVACAVMFTMTNSAQAQCYGGGYGGHFYGGYNTGFRGPVVYRQSYVPVVRSYSTIGYGYRGIPRGHIYNNYRGYNPGFRGYNRGGISIGIGF